MTLKAGGRVIRRTALRLHARDGGACGRCGRAIDVTLPGTHPLGLTIGHVRPDSLGGTDDDANLRPEHNRCNVSAGNRDASPPARLAVPFLRSDA